MKSFPIFLNVAERTVVICGGGEEAAQKARLVAKTEARMALMAPTLCPELRARVDAGAARHVPAVLDPAALNGAALVFVATGCAAADAAIAAVARDQGAVVNVVDRPELCDATTPAIVDRDPVVVAIGTEGASPVLARQIKTKLEAMLEPSLGRFTALAGALRDRVALRVAPAKRREFWRWAFAEGPRRLFASGDEPGARDALEAAIIGGGAPTRQGGMVSLVGAGPGAADLLTLRAVQRLQEADVIFYDRLVEPEVLELARRDAERVYVGKRPGCADWPQGKINQLVVAAGRSGKRVVRLKCGDPLVFGRASEEAAACEAEGVDWEVVPGVTSALAAAASAKVFPTRRGAAERLVLATAARAEGAGAATYRAALGPGASAAFYMGVGNAAALQDDLIASGAPEDLSVTIVEAASQSGERALKTVLGDLAAAVSRERVAHPAIIFIEWPETRARRVSALSVLEQPTARAPVPVATV